MAAESVPLRMGWAVGAFVGLVLIRGAWGQPSSGGETARVELDPVEITGTYLPDDPARRSAHVTVIPGEAVTEGQSSGVTEALRSVEGLHIDQAGARGSVSSVYLRGGDPNYTVVLIDGIKVNDPTNSRGGSFDFSTLNADEIERIEVVQGSLSSVYGSDAISGVINIITRRGGTDPETQLDLTAGSSGFNRERIGTRGRYGRLDYALSGSRLDNGEPVAGSGFVNAAGLGNIGVRLGRRTELRSVFRYSDSRMEAFPDDSGGPDYAVIRDSDHRKVDEGTAGVTLVHRPASALAAAVHVETFDRRETADSPGVAPGTRDPAGIPPNATDSAFRRYRAESHILWTPADRLRLTAGAEFQSEHGDSDGELMVQGQTIPTHFGLDRRLWAYFAEARIPLFEDFTLEGGIRSDHPEGFAARYAPRVGFVFTFPGTRTRLNANWGTGFKQPSFFALGHPIVGNPELDPERSRSAEIGLAQPIFENRASVHATYFYSRVDDAIDFEEALPPDWSIAGGSRPAASSSGGKSESGRGSPCPPI